MDRLPAEAEEGRLFKIEMVEVSKTQVLECRVEAAEVSTAAICPRRAGV
jgi:hypothetical protein